MPLPHTFHLLTLGTLRAPIADWLKLTPDTTPEPYREALSRPVLMPAQCLFIAHPEGGIVIDPCHPEAVTFSDLAPEGYQPPDLIRTQLAARGADPDAVTHVIITHPHFDHYSGIITEVDGEWRPTFPQARHLLGRADWEALQPQLANPESPVARSLGLIHQHGLLDPVEGDHDVRPGVTIWAAPGETVGHQIVRIEADERTFFWLGDLFHHPIEFAMPELTPPWGNPVAKQGSRARLFEAALSTNATLIVPHIPGTGHIEAAPVGGGVIWVAD